VDCLSKRRAGIVRIEVLYNYGVLLSCLHVSADCISFNGHSRGFDGQSRHFENRDRYKYRAVLDSELFHAELKSFA
jgi:hypothetical protein